MSRPGTGTSDELWATQFSCDGLHRRHLEVAGELHLPVDDVEEGVGAPLRSVGRPAAGARAAAPLVGEDHLGAVVVERRRVPVRVVRVTHRIEPHRVHRIGDVEQDAVALAGAGGEAELGVGRDVVAGVGVGQRGVRRAGRVQSAPGSVFCSPLNAPVAGIGEDPRLADDRRRLGGVERDLDHVDPPLRRVAGRDRGLRSARRSRTRRARAASARRPCRSCRCRCSSSSSGSRDDRVRVRAAARLHAGELHRVVDVADVEDADAAEPLEVDRARCALRAAVDAGRGSPRPT